MRVLLDEMYPPALAQALDVLGVDAVTIGGLGRAGAPDADVFAFAALHDRALLTENVADFTRLAADHVLAGHHHAGLLIALSARFSRRASGLPQLAAAVRSVAEMDLIDRVVYLRPGEGSVATP